MELKCMKFGYWWANQGLKCSKVTCIPCGIREYYEEEKEVIAEAYNHERGLAHSTSSGYFVIVEV